MSDKKASRAARTPAETDSTGEHARGLAELRTIANYQFGVTAGTALFPPGEAIEIRRSSSGRPRQLVADGDRLVSYGVDGRFTLGIAGGRRLVAAFDAPRCRVVVGDDSEPFVREGKNAFAKFVSGVDPEIRPGDELLIVHERGDLLAVGRAELSAEAMADFDSGMAVTVREGVDD
ncbi:MAG: prefoldin, molecular chaperone implicated in de novo protein folding, alpha subunit [Halonotius sp. J07HN4]|jgi:Prefoldin, molecular chaperone implicated in de novo protein folding, alpha subunit|nr:MAG: prefoldin, molecular chaperone implicated in de novo protein folding, alpha subunit [Halonotius sp. J07HN4]